MDGRRAFVGNPPYVRHHDLPPELKRRGQRVAAELGIKLSGLAGLHAHFIFAAAAHMNLGDVLCFITSAEWLDVNYGKAIRDLMLDGLRAEEIHLLDFEMPAFSDAASTAAIVCARAGGDAEHIRFKTADDPRALARLRIGGHLVSRSDLEFARSWGRIARNEYESATSSADIPLGAVARVHRGAVTGANAYFTMTAADAESLGLSSSVQPILSSAEEVLRADGEVRRTDRTKVILYPPDLIKLAAHDRRSVERYIEQGRVQGIDRRYVPSHREVWWRTQLLPAPPIVATYMARQAPVFALNPDGLRILNVIHGIYPHRPLAADQLEDLVQTLNALRETYRGHGRTYLGGLEKFEPKEMERLHLAGAAARRFAMLCDAAN